MTDTNVFQLSQPGTFADPLTEVLRNGAQALLAQAVEAEVAALLGCHADKLTADGHQRVVRHGHLPEREILTGIGPVAVRWSVLTSNVSGALHIHLDVGGRLAVRIRTGEVEACHGHLLQSRLQK